MEPNPPKMEPKPFRNGAKIVLNRSPEPFGDHPAKMAARGPLQNTPWIHKVVQNGPEIVQKSSPNPLKIDPKIWIKCNNILDAIWVAKLPQMLEIGSIFGASFASKSPL
jgi:hypothetical protein